jgi:hypothetical protein
MIGRFLGDNLEFRGTWGMIKKANLLFLAIDTTEVV